MTQLSNEAYLGARARSVLDGNWIGRATKPAPRLYPHQWSWDSAFIAIGNRFDRWDRAATELVTLFEAQWNNGMVPHIVFSPVSGTADPDYFPGPSWWHSKRSRFSPDDIATSGIAQPPVHATAIRMVVEAGIGDDGVDLAQRLVPGLDRWHRYLHSTRAIDGPLIETWHPWETGRDNNPEWDGPMAAVSFDRSSIPAYQRADVTHADPADRPSDAEYDTYIHLVQELQSRHYQPADPSVLGFRVRDILTNCVLVRAERDLAALKERIGLHGDENRERAAKLERAVHDHLWWPGTGFYHSMDVITGTLIPTRTSGAFLPLLLDDLDTDRLGPLVDNLDRHFLVDLGPEPGQAGGAVGRPATIPLTIPVEEPEFEPTRYWRGPSWINMAWLIAEGLDHQGERDRADRVRRGIVALCDDVGFHEYFDPRNRSGHGSDRFSWSAALVVDTLRRAVR